MGNREEIPVLRDASSTYDIVDAELVSGDYSWGVVAANWVLIAAFMLLEGSPRGLFELAVLGAAVTAVLYLLSSDRGQFRFWRCLTLSTWGVLAAIGLYGAL